MRHGSVFTPRWFATCGLMFALVAVFGTANLGCDGICWRWGDPAPGECRGEDGGDGSADDDAADDDLTADDDATEEPCTSPAGLDLVYVPPGTFWMGSPEDEWGRASDEDRHEVTLTQGFCIQKYEVTQAEFEDRRGYNDSDHVGCEDCPVETVTWHEAAAYSNAVSDVEGLEGCYACSGSGSGVSCAPVGNPYECEGYRLPTEAEWEYAARSAGEETDAYPNGGNLGPEDGMCSGGLELDNGTVLDESAWYCGNSGSDSHEVGTLTPNRLGLYDMSGNVAEWVEDGYEGYPAGAVTDPLGEGSYWVIRGGSRYSLPVFVRVAYRHFWEPSFRGSDLGLRLSRSHP